MKARELFAAMLVLVGAWYVAAWLVARPILPYPHDVAFAFVNALRGDLLLHTTVSAARITASMALAVGIAAPLGLLLGFSPRWRRRSAGLVYLLYPIPKVVFVPVIFLLFGIGEIARVVIVFLILFFQILVLVRDASGAIRPELLFSVRSLGAGRRALLRYVYLPASLPAILTALRQSVGTAVAVLYITELFATQYGLGYFIYLNGSTLFDYPTMYAGILAMSLLGLVMYFGVDGLEKIFCRWQYAH